MESRSKKLDPEDPLGVNSRDDGPGDVIDWDWNVEDCFVDVVVVEEELIN